MSGFPGRPNKICREFFIDEENLKTAVLFGFILCYTNFTYDDLLIKQDKISLEDNDVKIDVKNTRQMSRAEVIQVYIGFEESEIYRPA